MLRCDWSVRSAFTQTNSWRLIQPSATDEWTCQSCSCARTLYGLHVIQVHGLPRDCLDQMFRSRY